MRRNVTRHATGTDLETRPNAEIAPPGVSRVVSQPDTARPLTGRIIPAQNPYPAAFHGVHPAYQDIPLHVAALFDHHVTRREHPEILEIIRYYHLWPAPLVIAFSGFGWWANLEPNHIWLMLPYCIAGIAAPVAGVLAHHAHGPDADKFLSRGLNVVGVASLSGAAAVGAGWSGYSAMTTLLMSAVGTFASMGWRRHVVAADQKAAVEYASAVASAPMPPVAPNATSAPMPVPTSPQEAELQHAFLGLKISPIHVGRIEVLDADSYRALVTLPPGTATSPKAVIRRRDALRNNIGARQVSIVSNNLGNQIIVTVRHGAIDTLAETITRTEPGPTSITEPVPLGIDEYRTGFEITLLYVNTLIGGAVDNGKSGIVNEIVCSVIDMDDAVLWLIDVKPGQLELGIYEPVADRSARGAAQAALMLKAAVAVMHARGAYLRSLRTDSDSGEAVRKWDPTVHGPALVIVIDELAELFRQVPDAVEDFETLSQVARALGITLVGAASDLSSTAFSGGKSGRTKVGISGQFQNLLCVRTTSSTQTNVILGPGAHGEGFDATMLDAPGKFLAKTRAVSNDPTVRKGYWRDDTAIAAKVRARTGKRPPLDDISANAADDVLGDVALPGTPGPDGPGGGQPWDVANEFHADYPRLYAVPPITYPDGSDVDDKDRQAWETFKAMGSATVMDLMAKRLPGMGSREPCMTALKAFKEHGGATSERDADGRSERFMCTVPAPQRREA